MVVINLHKEISATPQQLLSTLTEHEQLSRFFNGQHVVIKESDPGQIAGGKGCRRQVTTLGQTFVEEITEADLSGIKYHIVGSTPLKHHKGIIKFEVVQNQNNDQDRTIVHYYIEGIAPNHLPEFLVQLAIKRNINIALRKIEKYFNKLTKN